MAYRKAGYSKKFLAEHEADILLHKAAKKAFDEMGIKKLPTVKSLQAEYAELLAEKKSSIMNTPAPAGNAGSSNGQGQCCRLMGYDERKKNRSNSRKKRPNKLQRILVKRNGSMSYDVIGCLCFHSFLFSNQEGME